MASPQGSVSGGCGKFRTRSNVVCAMSSSASLCARSAALASACSTTEVDITQMYPKLRILDLKSWDQKRIRQHDQTQFHHFFHSRRFSTHLKKVIFGGVVVNGWERGLTDRKGRSRKVHGSFTVVSRYHFPHKYCVTVQIQFGAFTILARARYVLHSFNMIWFHHIISSLMVRSLNPTLCQWHHRYIIYTHVEFTRVEAPTGFKRSSVPFSRTHPVQQWG